MQGRRYNGRRLNNCMVFRVSERKLDETLFLCDESCIILVFFYILRHFPATPGTFPVSFRFFRRLRILFQRLFGFSGDPRLFSGKLQAIPPKGSTQIIFTKQKTGAPIRTPVFTINVCDCQIP
jgi:hypothetical protein